MKVLMKDSFLSIYKKRILKASLKEQILEARARKTLQTNPEIQKPADSVSVSQYVKLSLLLTKAIYMPKALTVKASDL